MGKDTKGHKMFMPTMSDLQRWFGTLMGTTGLICLLLAFSFSMTSGISYVSALAQVRIFYQYGSVLLSTLISS